MNISILKSEWSVLIGLILSFIIFGSSTYAQRVIGQPEGIVVHASKVTARQHKEKLIRFGEVTKDLFKVYTGSEDGIEEQTYNAEAQLISTKTVDFTTGFKRGHWNTIRLLGKSYAVNVIQENGDNVVTKTEIDPTGHTLEESSEILRLSGIDSNKDISQADVFWEVSKRQEKVLLIVRMPEPTNTDPTATSTRKVVFDSEFNVVWNRIVKFQPPVGVIKRGGDSWILDNGSIATLLRIDKGRGFDVAERFEIQLRLTDGEDESKTAFLEEGKVLPVSAFSQDNSVIIICTYGLRSAEGFLIVKWDGENDLVITKVPYGLKHLTKKVGESAAKKTIKNEAKGKPLPLDKFKIDGVTLRENGSLFIYGQQRWTGDNFIASNIHFFNIDMNGNQLWTQMIPLKHSLNGIGFGSRYAISVIEDRVHVIFNDNYRNLDGDWKEGINNPAQYSGPDNPVVLVTFDMTDPDETYHRSKLWDSKDVGGIFHPGFYSFDEESKIAVAYIQGGRSRQCIVRIEFE